LSLPSTILLVSVWGDVFILFTLTPCHRNEPYWYNIDTRCNINSQSTSCLYLITLAQFLIDMFFFIFV